jgi:hypothetical protein
MTFLFWVAMGELELDVVRQNGDAVLVLLVSTYSDRWVYREHTRRDLCVGKQLVSYPRCHDACCSWEEHEPTWTISCRRLSASLREIAVSRHVPAAAASSW